MNNMKKIYFIVFAVITGFAVLSCSDETTELPNKPYGDMSFIVNDVQRTFNNVRVTEHVSSTGQRYLNVVGSNNGVPGEYISFRINKYQTGADRATRWTYSQDSNLAKRTEVEGQEYDINSNTSLNSDTRLRGTFSGQLYNDYSDIVVTIEAGEFNYNYNLPE